MFRTALMGAAMLGALSLAACGTTPTERGLTGAGIGAATGAVIGGVTGGDVGTGAVVGGVVGGAVGALTTKDEIDIGDPPWKKSCKERQRRGEKISCKHKPRN
jgi:osmotically inducible lipoprotein OsmB